MKQSTIRFLLIVGISLVLAACNGNENQNNQEQAADYSSKTEVDNNQLPISTVRTDSSSNRQETDKMRFKQAPLNNRRNEEDPLERNLEQNNDPQIRKNPAGQEPIDRNGNNAQQESISQYASKVIELTNQERSKQGLPALKADKQLSRVANNKSMDMQQKNYFSHKSPTYGSPFEMMKQFDVTYESAGENIARGQPKPSHVVDSWMNSADHRKNILDESFTHIGVGFTRKGNYWTQMFIEK
ncbi:hypothetical protein GCM10008983_12690 [Lentibacillus halophilus]|uniref:SCP domain-containing protein n=1 Tax=Lentibacillus halophilus TaxID=295065 RepID=A0ABP3J1F8_9BACI